MSTLTAPSVIPSPGPSTLSALTRPERMLAMLAGLLAATRLAVLPFTPPGFYVDEAGVGANVRAMLDSSASSSGVKWPFFADSVAGGFTSPVYLYPLTIWSQTFGAGERALRYFSAVATLISIVMLALAVRYWMGRRFALMQAVVALALPWGWLQGSLAWDPALVPLFISAAFLSFSALLFSANTGHRRWALLLLPASLVGAAYLYPPSRASAPLLGLALYAVLWRRRAISTRSVAGSAAFALVLALPLVHFMTSPAARQRSVTLSVFTGVSVWDGFVHLVANLWLLLSPAFLFLQGDPNLRHSTGRQGMLGLAAVIPVLVVVAYAGHRCAVRAQRRSAPASDRLPLLLAVATAGTFAGLIGSALTWEGQPHSLRACAAWPFLAILVTIGWSLLLRGPTVAVVVAMGVFAVGTATYVADLVLRYPDRAAVWFDVGVREQIERGAAVDYPELGLRYYQGPE